MINLDQILKEAIRSNASDIHLVMGKRPMLRISKSLNEMEDQDILQEDDMYEMYDYFDLIASFKIWSKFIIKYLPN